MNNMNFQMYMIFLFIGLAIVLIAIFVLIWKVSCQSKAIYSMQNKNTGHIQPIRDSQREVPKEVIAAISAAVYAVYGNAAIKSIRRVEKPARSPWAMAGLIDNTRPF